MQWEPDRGFQIRMGLAILSIVVLPESHPPTAERIDRLAELASKLERA